MLTAEEQCAFPVHGWDVGTPTFRVDSSGSCSRLVESFDAGSSRSILRAEFQKIIISKKS